MAGPSLSSGPVAMKTRLPMATQAQAALLSVLGLRGMQTPHADHRPALAGAEQEVQLALRRGLQLAAVELQLHGGCHVSAPLRTAPPRHEALGGHGPRLRQHLQACMLS